MALMGVAPDVMKPTALILNVVVSIIATTRFARAGCFSWPILWPFALTSIPMAFLGGSIMPSAAVYKRLVGGVLIFSAYRLWRRTKDYVAQVERPPLWPSLLWGAVIGFLSGITGTGGGIFLSPLLLFLGWADARRAAGVSSAFILMNSLAGLSGLVLRGFHSFAWAEQMTWWILAALLGGLLGSEIGSRRAGHKALRRLLSWVLVLAGAKLLWADGF